MYVCVLSMVEINIYSVSFEHVSNSRSKIVRILPGKVQWGLFKKRHSDGP